MEVAVATDPSDGSRRVDPTGGQAIAFAIENLSPNSENS